MSITVKRTSLLDFASALYLGLSHPSKNLQAWEQLTTGKPAALATPPGAIEVSQQLAVLQGCQSATLATSTLHLYWDFFGTFAGRPMTIYADAETYPIALWGVERARARGASVETFAHQDVNDLRRLLKQRARSGSVQMVVADGFCPDCGRVAPIGEYVATAVSFGGSVVVDDTQALGILGARGDGPYGDGGGGVFRWHGLASPNLVGISSLAKGFGVPLAALVGSAEGVRRFTEMSETNVHCSPPSVAILHAARRALEINSRVGNELRSQLARRVRQFRQRLREMGLSSTGGMFPVQTLKITSDAAKRLHLALQRSGVQSVLRRAHIKDGARLTFIITARHRPGDIDQVADLIGVLKT